MTATANIQTCGTCRFSAPGKKRGPDGAPVIDFTRRMCRRYPPETVMIPTAQGLSMEFVWPVLETSQCCGEWQPNGMAEPLLLGERKPEVAAAQ